MHVYKDQEAIEDKHTAAAMQRNPKQQWGVPKAEEGELIAEWGKRMPENTRAELCYSWQNNDGMNADRWLIKNMLTMRQYDSNGKESKMIIEELDARGYDLTTLHFSVSKASEGAEAGQA